MPKIKKTVIQVTVLHESDADVNTLSLADVAAAISDGDLIGTYEVMHTSDVPAHYLQAELEAVGNDGSFFGAIEDEDGYHEATPAFTVYVSGLSYERVLELAVLAPDADAAESVAATYMTTGDATGVRVVSDHYVELDDNTLLCEVEQAATDTRET